jgi:dTMP kinase
MTGGRFITFEGGEGAGKSTQIGLLEASLSKDGKETAVTREPGGAIGAEEIRRLLVDGPVERWEPITEALLHFAARRCHLHDTVWPALARGAWVLSDRFADSTRAYQGFAQGLGDDFVLRLYAMVVGDFKPDLTIILDIPVEVGLARAHGPEDRYERMGTAFHEAVRQAYLEIADREPERCVVVDGARSADAVAESVLAAVRERLEPGS